jgi:hypothetical protein
MCSNVGFKMQLITLIYQNWLWYEFEYNYGESLDVTCDNN